MPLHSAPVVTSEGDSPLDLNLVWLEDTKTKPLQRNYSQPADIGDIPDHKKNYHKRAKRFDYVSDQQYDQKQPEFFSGYATGTELLVATLVFFGALKFISK